MVTATQAGNGTYAPASASKMINVIGKTQAITLTVPAKGTAGQTGAITATSSSKLPVTITVSGATWNGKIVSFDQVGTVTVTATQAGNNAYAAATITKTFVVAAVPKKNQTITLKVVGAAKQGTAAIVTYAATSKLPVTLSVTGATLNGNTLTFDQTGIVTITATQAGNIAYNAVTASATVAVVGMSVADATYVYDGTAKSLTVATSPANYPVTILYGKSAIPPTAAGTYVVTIAAANKTLARIIKASATLTITKRDLQLTASNASKVRGSANPAFSVSATGMASTDVLHNNLTATCTASAKSPVGTYPITPILPKETWLKNYTVSTAKGTLTITNTL